MNGILKHKKILLGLTGGIAAYKSAEIIRLLQKNHCQVRVAMTDSAAQFMTPLTLETLSGHRVYRDIFDETADPMLHISLARWADLVLIAPATANFIARLNQGMADDLLTTLCLASQAPVALAPAMNQQMWQQASTQHNINALIAKNIIILGPDSGIQACGELGPGRMLEPETILGQLQQQLPSKAFDGLHLLINAGPTVEDIDPVRFISNRSSGKMGFALARAAREMGARVSLIAGPVQLETPEGVERTDVRTAEQMLQACEALAPQTDIFIATAAVADYRPIQTSEQKIKKQAATLTLELERNPDILATISGSENRPFCVGFAAETTNLRDYAQTKLKAKKLDMIAANWVGEQAQETNGGFDSDSNALLVFEQDNCVELKPASKTVIAQQLLQLIRECYEKNRPENS